MVVLKRRSRVVTFRVSAAEYDALSQACTQSGARSISDFARAAVLHKVEAVNAPVGTLSGDLMTVTRALTELDASLADIRRRIRDVLGPVRSGGEGVSTRQ